MTVKCGIDRCHCLSLLIINTTDYILFGKTGVFVLRILQCTNIQCGPDADMSMFGTYSYQCAL